MNRYVEAGFATVGIITVGVIVFILLIDALAPPLTRAGKRYRAWREARQHQCCGACAEEYQEAQEATR